MWYIYRCDAAACALAREKQLVECGWTCSEKKQKENRTSVSTFQSMFGLPWFGLGSNLGPPGVQRDSIFGSTLGFQIVDLLLSALSLLCFDVAPYPNPIFPLKCVGVSRLLAEARNCPFRIGSAKLGVRGWIVCLEEKQSYLENRRST